MKPFYVIVPFVLLALSCGSKKSVPASEVYSDEQIGILQAYPKLNGYMPNVVTVPEKEDESLLKVQVVPGKNMEIDCNRHGLQGKYERKMLGNGDTYFIFLSKGQVFSTLMACPEDVKRTSFVPGPTIFTAYNSQRPFVVYTPHGVGLKYRIWESGEMLTAERGFAPSSIQDEELEVFNAFPEVKEDYERYIIVLPEYKDLNKTEFQIEIVPGFMAEVDCANHTLNGTFTTETVEGWGYQYLVFQTDGHLVSDKTDCPDKQKKSKFIYGKTETISYNSQIPAVIFAPKGIEVRYRIWESPRIVL